MVFAYQESVSFFLLEYIFLKYKETAMTNKSKFCKAKCGKCQSVCGKKRVILASMHVLAIMNGSVKFAAVQTKITSN